METRVSTSELKKEGSDLVEELVEFLKEKTKTEIEQGTDDITLKDENNLLSRTHLRVLLRKFLHKKELKDYYRIIAGKEGNLVVKERKTYEEE